MGSGISVRADNVKISGFTIISNSSNMNVVFLSGTNDYLTENTIRVAGNNSVAVGASDSATVSSNIIEGAGKGYGVCGQ